MTCGSDCPNWLVQTATQEQLSRVIADLQTRWERSLNDGIALATEHAGCRDRIVELEAEVAEKTANQMVLNGRVASLNAEVERLVVANERRAS